MKTALKVLCIIMAVLTVLPLLAACNTEKPQESSTSGTTATTQTTATSNTDKNEQKPSDSTATEDLIIFENGKYVCNFVLAENPSVRDTQTFEKIATRLEQYTGKKPEAITEKELPDDSVAMYVGRVEATQVIYSGLKYGEAKAKLSDGELILAFTSDATANQLLESFDQALSWYENGKLSLSKNYSDSIESFKGEVVLPKYDSTSRTFLDVGNDTKMLQISNTTAAAYYDYVDKLLGDGFIRHSQREVGANVFTTLVKGDKYVYTYFGDNAKTVRIIMGPLANLPVDAKENVTVENYEASLNLVGQVYNTTCGAGIIYVLPDGRLLVIDGGEKYDGYNSKGEAVSDRLKPDYVYEAIKAVAPDKNNIVVAAWFFTHPHNDHQEGFEEFIDNGHHHEIKIESLVYNYATPQEYVLSDDDGSAWVTSLNDICDNELPQAQQIKAHTGQVLYYGSVQVEIMYTVEDYLPSKLSYINSSSLVVRVNYRGQKALFLADTTHASSAKIEAFWGDSIRSDMVQIAHHGLWAGNSSLYERIQAYVLLFSQNTHVIKSAINQVDHKDQINTALGYASDVYTADYGVVNTIKLPYDVIYNKEAFMSSIGK